MNARQIVVGFDGSESSRLALTWAMRAAKARELPVLVAHAGIAAVASVGGSLTLAEDSHDALMQAERTMVQEALHEARREVPGVDVESTIVTGLPADALLRVLDHAEMLVVGSRGLGSFAALLVGSTSLQVATHAACPVVVVRSLDYYRSQPSSRSIEKVVLSGGTALCMGLDRYLRQGLSIPVEVGDAGGQLDDRGGMSMAMAHRASVAIGLAMDGGGAAR